MSGIYFSGLSSGIDYDAMVTYLMGLEREPLARVADQKKELQAKESCWQEIRSRLLALEQGARELRRSSIYELKTASADREGAVALTAGTAAAVGSYRLEILALARAHSVASDTAAAISGDGGADAGSALGLSGTLRIDGAALTVEAGDSLQEICARINGSEGAGITAAIIDGRLVLTRAQTGAVGMEIEDNGLARSLGLIIEAEPGSGIFGARVIQEGCDARLRLNGLEVTRSVNIIDDLLEGVTFKLLRADEQPLTVTVAEDHSSLIGKIESFIQNYNSTYQFVKAQTAVDPKAGTRGILHGESSLNQVLATIRQTLSGVVEEAGIHNCLAAIGISTAKWDSGHPEGTLILDQAKLREALENEPGAVAALLCGERGVTDRLQGYLGNLTRSGEGLIHSRSEGIERRIRDLDRRAEALEQRLDKREQTLRQQFLAAERVIGQMNDQGQWLDQQLALMTRWTNPEAR